MSEHSQGSPELSQPPPSLRYRARQRQCRCPSHISPAGMHCGTAAGRERERDCQSARGSTCEPAPRRRDMRWKSTSTHHHGGMHPSLRMPIPRPLQWRSLRYQRIPSSPMLPALPLPGQRTQRQTRVRWSSRPAFRFGGTSAPVQYHHGLSWRGWGKCLRNGHSRHTAP